ncbi:MAG: bifunctional 5,10-methylenetetrahydrofolate dehydrogenase/5,10-methenyltetrahydrofolate cyclohydrolase [Candidatus Omnitrophica bacterium]|nr:bifunctional 5,10-methylenetetrahydrofolate dehydrogenase/5,10-methenyltetrahydrofolate cyclohydrolase [Candidatus Omnitrophota bacterium]MCM8831337.1 bifunctional 5,10-methylenetetrahydrofolate dehydrogenase/5,10-methenyltetrahydrofolate cyclohydrolase [Candidatus Omnitrophota bacterium]
MGKILEVNKIYFKLKNDLIKERAKIKQSLCLASVITNKDSSSKIYLSIQKNMARELKVKYLPIEMKSNVSSRKLVKKIERLNKDKEITGIILNKPFPKNIKESLISQAIAPTKDIEGINPYNLGRLCIGKPIFIPPTVLSILEILKSIKIKIYGKDVTIIGFSTIIGKPLAMLLGEKFATVNITHIGTYKANRLPFYINQADILISAVGKPHIIKGDWIKKGAVVIDVGIATKGKKIVGDVELDSAIKNASYISPVPGGVGRLTPLFLFKNLFKSAKLNKI